jgi:RNA polymerase sigma-70 factor, ECF subfamily
MTALAAAFTGSRETGADLAHEAMIRAYRSWTTVSAYDRPGAWVRRVVINLATDARRRSEREKRATHRLRVVEAVDSDFGVNDRFWVAVRQLPERQRAAVALHYLDDMSIDAIAEVLEMAVGTVKSTLFAARRSLALSLGAEEVTQ